MYYMVNKTCIASYAITDDVFDCRKRENIVIQNGVISKTSHGPRAVVRIESQEDIPDDGYSWRKNKIGYDDSFDEFSIPPSSQASEFNNEAFLVSNMVSGLISDHAESSNSDARAACGSLAPASSATGAVPPPPLPFLFDLNLPPPQELYYYDDDDDACLLSLRYEPDQKDICS
ncbi:unnamed protein product [Lupinus luteus]|uniref:Uncharacterized protein n=1 Tax=Lupinus luteus TaxID=3873 RepID=A0AAV1VSP8_LUPLU